jgi:hypothetical protein
MSDAGKDAKYVPLMPDPDGPNPENSKQPNVPMFRLSKRRSEND